ncbi:MAG TPA: hypothetical protein VL418_03905 [Devosiaceae bacterium]|nr:hypothetical protein [Devosiaceae bacterium]
MKLKTVLGLAALACLVLPLADCATLNPFATVTNPINQTEVFQLGNASGTAKALAVGYAALPLCPVGTAISTTNICHSKSVLVTIQKDVHAADTAYTALQAFARNPANYPGLNFSQLLQTAEDAIATVSQIEAQYNIGKAS